MTARYVHPEHDLKVAADIDLTQPLRVTFVVSGEDAVRINTYRDTYDTLWRNAVRLPGPLYNEYTINNPRECVIESVAPDAVLQRGSGHDHDLMRRMIQQLESNVQVLEERNKRLEIELEVAGEAFESSKVLWKKKYRHLSEMDYTSCQAFKENGWEWPYDSEPWDGAG